MENIRYSLGLDIGIASVGWAVLENDVCGEPFRIERLGSRIFERAEVAKTGASLAADRRQARSAGRVTRRRRHRKERIRHLMLTSGMLTEEQLAMLFSHAHEESIYALRVRALDQRLEAEEAARLLIHLAQRRGYRSNSKSEESKDEKENGKVKGAISANKARMEKNHYRTVGEMLWKDDFFWLTNPDGSRVHTVRNKSEEYKTTVDRSMLLEELNLLFASQRTLGADWATEEFQEKYLAIWGGQRNFDEGPGEGADGRSKYGGLQIERMLGKCTFEKGELRAPKASYTAEYFRLLQTVNNLKVTGHGLPPEFLDDEQRKTILAFALKSPGLTYAKIRKAISLPEDYYFNSVSYGEKKRDEVEKKTKFKQMTFYHELRVALDKVEKNLIQKLTPEQMDEIARITMLYKSDDNRRLALAAAGIPQAWMDTLLTLSASRAAHLSIVAMKKLLPYLEQGETYDKACTAVYGSHDGKPKGAVRKTRLSLFDAGEITNPVVKRAVSQAVKVINAVVREYGPPEVVRVELAREMGKPFEVRTKLKKKNEENQARNEHIRERIAEYKSDNTITGQDIIKFKLYEEQQGICLYSGKHLDIARLFEPGYVDVDHILPYSKTFDDSYSNKVLVLSAENRQKGNRIPYAYFGANAVRWEKFEALVEGKIRSYRKRKNLLTHSLTEEQSKGYKQRNLADTQYLSRIIFNLIDTHLQFNETGNYKKKTYTVNGAVTAQVRKRLGIEKIRADGDLHHAKDAAVIACISDGTIQKITKFAQQCERIYATSGGYVDMETGELLTRAEYEERYSPNFPAPWEHFRAELEARLSNDPQKGIELLQLTTYDTEKEILPVFVSRMPRHKVTGAAHKETIRSGKKAGGTVSKKPLSELKLNREGEIEGYYNPESDRLLYDALKERLVQFGGKGTDAFSEPFYKPKHDGTPGSLVKKVKVYESATITVSTDRGIAGNGEMVRVDVFHVDGDGYYFVPLYVPDTVKTQLPNRAVVANKPYEQWKEMREEDFVFSLCAGDLIRIVNKREVKLKLADGAHGAAELLQKDGLYYYAGLNIHTGALAISTHDRKYAQPGLGGKKLGLIEKFTVDVLGNYHPVRLPEKRMPFGD